MLTEVLAYLRNYFTRSMCFGHFTIENGELQAQYSTGIAFGSLDIKSGQYFRIIGSVLNDGVYKYPTNKLSDEEFDGAVWLLAVPPAVLSIVKEIEAWQEKNGGADSAAMSPFQSESFGGYSYSKGGSNSAGGSDAAITWDKVFANRLASWRKI